MCNLLSAFECLLIHSLYQFHTVVRSTNLLRQNHYNYTGTAPTSYPKVFEPCGQTLTGIVGTLLLNDAWHYMQTQKHQDELANWVSGLLAVSLISFAMRDSISYKMNFHEDYMVLWWIALHHTSCTIVQWFCYQSFYPGHYVFLLVNHLSTRALTTIFHLLVLALQLPH